MAARNYVKMCGERLTKSEKKALRKQRCKMHSLQRHNAELEVSQEPTEHLLVGNGGLMNGVDRTQIVKLFKSFGIVERVTMVPQRSYSFVTFTNVEDARKAMNYINGRKLDPSNEFSTSGIVLYLSYLRQVPNEITSTKKNRPPGLILAEDFITEEEEKHLLGTFKWDDSQDDNQTENDSETVQKQLKHRRVKHFGYEFLYGTNNVDASKPLPGGIPDVCSGILQRMISSGYIQEIPDQLTVNEYHPGQGIPPHVDTHSAFEDTIVSLSLGAKITMEFRSPDGQHIPVLLPQRSLLVMSGESRYHWTHGITPRKFDIVSVEGQITTSNGGDNGKPCDRVSNGVTQYERGKRISLTFRKIKQTPCKCNFPQQCDSQNFSSPDSTHTLPTNHQDAKRLETTHVHEVYEKIADHFSDTRHSPWPKIASFLRDLPVSSLVADVGCGNGKYLGINNDIFKTGSDRSFNLASIAKERGHSVIVCDVLHLPYRSEAFDVCICIAVLHHLSTNERRLEGLRELVRIVRPGGQVLVYVWALEQNLERIKKTNLKELEFSSKTREHTKTDGIALSPNKAIDSDIKCEIGEQSLSSVKAGSKEAGSVQINMKREVFEQQDLFVPWKFRGGKGDINHVNQHQHQNNSNVNGNQASTSSNVFHRFYHVFKEGELLDLCSHIDNVDIKELYYDRGNWCAVLEKKT